MELFVYKQVVDISAGIAVLFLKRFFSKPKIIGCIKLVKNISIYQQILATKSFRF